MELAPLARSLPKKYSLADPNPTKFTDSNSITFYHHGSGAILYIQLWVMSKYVIFGN